MEQSDRYGLVLASSLLRFGKEMHGSLSPISTPDQVQDTATEPARSYWPVMGLALGGVLTLAWIGFLLWTAFKVLEWLFS